MAATSGLDMTVRGNSQTFSQGTQPVKTANSGRFVYPSGNAPDLSTNAPSWGRKRNGTGSLSPVKVG